MQTRSSFLSQKSRKFMKQDDDILSRCSRNEDYHGGVPVTCSRNEDYHGGVPVTVPFDWEREPGTPKVKSSEIPTLPPLTPPPSYFYSTPNRSVKKQNHLTPKLLHTMVPQRYRRKTRVQLCAGSSSSSSSSSSASSSGSSSPWPRSYSVPSSPTRALNLDELSRGRLFCDSRADVKELREYTSCIVSSPCFGRGAGTRSSGGFRSTLLKVLRRH